MHAAAILVTATWRRRNKEIIKEIVSCKLRYFPYLGLTGQITISLGFFFVYFIVKHIAWQTLTRTIRNLERSVFPYTYTFWRASSRNGATSARTTCHLTLSVIKCFFRTWITIWSTHCTSSISVHTKWTRNLTGRSYRAIMPYRTRVLARADSTGRTIVSCGTYTAVVSQWMVAIESVGTNGTSEAEWCAIAWWPFRLIAKRTKKRSVWSFWTVVWIFTDGYARGIIWTIISSYRNDK